MWIGIAVAEELTFPTTEDEIFKILSLAQGFPASLLYTLYPLTSPLVQVELRICNCSLCKFQLLERFSEKRTFYRGTPREREMRQ